MNDKDLMVLRHGGVSFEDYVQKNAGYFRRQAIHFHRKGSGAPMVSTGMVTIADLEQIGRLALWVSVKSYKFRCPLCHRSSTSAAVYIEHGRRRHGLDEGQVVRPNPGIYRWCHGAVGHAMGHEMQRHWRRRKFAGKPPKRPIDGRAFESGVDKGERWEDRVPDARTPEGELMFRELVDAWARAHYAGDLARTVFRVLALGEAAAYEEGIAEGQVLSLEALRREFGDAGVEAIAEDIERSMRERMAARAVALGG